MASSCCWHGARNQPSCALRMMAAPYANSLTTKWFIMPPSAVTGSSWSLRARTAPLVCEVATGKLAGPLLEHKGSVDWSQFSSDGSKLLTVQDRHFVQIWNWRDGQRL